MGGVVVENLETSLPVASVQELVASQKPDKVPSRYITDEDYPNHNLINHSLRVPLIDMAKLLDPHTQPLELHNLLSACKDWGLFQIINHGVPSESLTNMKIQAQDYFDLPLPEKQLCAQKPGSLEGFGQTFVASEEQKLQWNDMFFLKVLPPKNRNMEMWPQNPPRFRETLEKYAEDIRKVAISITKFMGMALGLGLKSQECEDLLWKGYEHEGAAYEVRLNYYPPCPQPEKVVGIVPHADISGITLLLECGDKPGLQVLKDGQWVFVPPIDGAIVVDIGQIIEIMSNGLYKGAYHRAVVNKEKERISVATFCYPSPSVNIGPAKEIIESGIPPLFKTVTLETYMHCFFNRKFEVPFLDSLKL